MRKHAALIRPKFQLVDDILTRELDGLGIGRMDETQREDILSPLSPWKAARKLS